VTATAAIRAAVPKSALTMRMHTTARTPMGRANPPSRLRGRAADRLNHHARKMTTANFASSDG